MINTLSAFAGPSRTTYQAKIIKPDGYPLEAAVVNFQFSILEPAGCMIYAETFSGVNMGSSLGLVSFSLGSGVRVYPVSGSTFEQVFSNTTASLPCESGGTPGTYSPTDTDARKIIMQFNDGSGWQTLPAMTINAVPYAMYSNDSLKFRGKDVTEFVQVATLPTCSASEAMRFNGVAFSCVAVGGAGGSVTSGSVITALGYTPATDTTVALVSSTVFSVSSTVSTLANSVSTLAASTATSFSALTSSQWTTSGSTIFYNSGNVGLGTSAPTAPLQVVREWSTAANLMATFDSYGSDPSRIALRRANGTIVSSTAITAGQSLGNLNFRGHNGTDFSAGALAAITAFAAENFSPTNMGTALTFATTAVSSTGAAERMRISPAGYVGIGTTAPVTTLDVSGGVRIGIENASCDSSYAGTLRYNSGVVEYCNGTTWSAFGVSGAGILAINGLASGSQTFATGIAGTSPNISSIGSIHTFNFPFASAATTTAGLISYSDYLNFSSKQIATSAAMIATLGYTPADAVSVTTLSSTVSNFSTVTGASFTTLNSALVASFTAITSSQWISSGTSIFYPTGNVGIGTSTPNAALAVTANQDTITTARVSNQSSGTAATAMISIDGDSGAAGFLIRSSNYATVTSSTGRTNGAALYTSMAASGGLSIAARNSQGIITFHTGGETERMRIDAAGAITATSDIISNNYKAYMLSRALPTTIDDYVELGRFNYGNRSYNLKVTVTVDAPNVAITKIYFLPVRYFSSTTWYTALPNNQSIWGADNVDLDVMPGTFGDAAVYLRLRRSSGSVAANATVKIEQDGYTATTFTSMSGTGTASVPAAYFESTALTQFNGRVGIGVSSPVSRLHIVDSFANMLTLERSSSQNSLIEYKNNLGSAYAGVIAGSNDWGVGHGLDLASSATFRVASTGRVYIGGTTTPTARLQITPGTSSVAPVKLGLGVLLASPQAGAIEYDGSYYYITDNFGLRRTIATASTAGVLNDVNTVSSTSGIALWPASGNSVTVSSTVASTNSSTGALIVNGGAGISAALNVGGIISGSAIIKGTGFRANQGVPDAADSSTNGYAFGEDGDTGIFSPGSGGANGVLAFYSNNGERMRLTASGSLGIGTSSPVSKLDISAADSSNQAWIRNTDSTAARYPGMVAQNFMGGIAQGFPAFNVLNSRGSATAATPVQASDILGAIVAGGNFNTTPSYTNAALIQFLAAGNYSAGNTPSIITFSTTSVASSVAVERVRIDAAGNVGIGTANPIYQLDTSSTVRFSSGSSGGVRIGGGLLRIDSNADAGSALKIIGTQIVAGQGNSAGYGYSGGGLLASRSVGDGVIALDVTTAQATGAAFKITQQASQMVMNLSNALGTTLYAITGGNVGIGTATPQTGLHVSGTVTIANPSGSSYNENLRLPVANNDYASIALGSSSATTLGAVTGQWSLVRYPALTFSNMFSIRHLNTDYFNITTGGNVGIGTASPTTRLQIADGTQSYTFSSTSQAPLSLLKSDLTGPYAYVVGKAHTLNNTGNFRYNHIGDGSTSNYIGIGFWGNDDLLNLKATGQVGIGTAAPTATLHVSGTARITDGNQAAGRVLASDASGNASWKQAIIHGTINSTANSSTSAGVAASSGVSITLPPGRWLISGMGITTSGSCRADFGIRVVAGGVVKYQIMPVPNGDFQTQSVSGYVDIGSTTTYELYIASRANCTSTIHVDNNLWELTATGVSY